MTKTETDRRLALAVGYPADRVRVHKTIFRLAIGINGSWRYTENVQVLNYNSRMDGPMQYHGWQRFDHTDSEVFRNVAERFDAFPYKLPGGQWYAHISADCFAFHDNPATASALAVIRHFESKA